MPNSSALRTCSARPLISDAERLSLHELEHQEGPISVLADLEQHRDVRMRQVHQSATGVVQRVEQRRISA